MSATQTPIMRSLEYRTRRVIINPHVVAFVALSFLWVVFFWRLYTPVPEDQVVFPTGDFTVHYYPFASYQADRLYDGEIPLWNPYNNAGDPFAADPQSSVWYPPRWLAMWLSQNNGYTQADFQRYVGFHYWLASILMYGFLRVVTRRSSTALIGGVLFAYGGYLTGYPMLQATILQSVVWLPLVLLGIHLTTTRPTWAVRGLLIGALGLGLSFLGGHPQTNLHVIYISFAYMLFMGYSQHLSLPSIFGRSVAVYTLAVLIGLVQLWPALEFTNLSSRVDQFTYIDKSTGFAIVDTLQVIWPRLLGIWSPLYIGVAGIVLALGAMIRRKPHTIFWTAVVIVSLFVSFGNNSIVYDVFYLFVPGMGVFRQQERIVVGFAFGLAMLAAFQINWLANRPLAVEYEDETQTAQNDIYHKRYMWISYGHAILTVLVAALFIFSRTLNDEPLSDETTNTFMFVAFISVLFVMWQRWQSTYRDSRTIVLGVLLMLITVDLFTIGTRSDNFLPATPENLVPPPVMLEQMQVEDPTAIRWRVDGAAGLQDYGTYWRIPDIYGTSPLFLQSVDELRQIPDDRVWEVLAVRYVTTTDEPPAELQIELLASGQNLDGEEYRLFELTNPRPMAHLVYQHTLGHNNEFTRTMMSDEQVNLREVAVTNIELPFELAGERPESAAVEDMHFNSPEDMRVTVTTPANALLTIAIPNYPGWHASVNGDSVEIIDTYAGLIGIPIEGQDAAQAVRLQFRPRSVIWGGLISGFVSLSALVWLIIGSKGATTLARLRQSRPS